MYTLRTVNKEKNAVPLNEFIGRRYSLATPVNMTEAEWEKEIKQYYPEIESIKGIVAIVISDSARLIYKNFTAYIMCSDGSTFEKIN